MRIISKMSPYSYPFPRLITLVNNVWEDVHRRESVLWEI